MKFPQLKIGERFVYQGEIYTKNGPLTAIHAASGKQKMLNRSVTVELAGAGDIAPSPKKKVDSVAAFYELVMESIDSLEADPSEETFQRVRRLLEDAANEAKR